MLHSGDKIKLVKQIGNFDHVGEVFDVTNVSEEGFISFKSYMGIGTMTFLEFAGYFEQVKDSEWTDWIRLEEDVSAYKTDGKTVVVRYNGYIGKANCCETDTFDLDVGIEIALCRAKIKYLSV